MVSLFRVKEKAMSVLTKACTVKRPSPAKIIFMLLVLCAASLLWLSYNTSNNHFNNVVRTPPEPTVKCHLKMGHNHRPIHVPNNHLSSASLRIDNKVLVLVETQYSRVGQSVVALLEANRMKFKVELAGKSLPYLTHMDKGKFGVIVFENLKSYLNMDKWNRQLLDKYCREYNVGMVYFTFPSDNSFLSQAQVKDFPLCVHTTLTLKDYELNPHSTVLRMTRPGEIAYGELPGNDWTVFVPNHTTYEAVAFAKISSTKRLPEDNKVEETLYTTVLQDIGLYDGIKRVFFGNSFKFWLHKLLFIDSLSFLSHGKFSVPLDRYIQIDIDDIFVGRRGIRMKTKDVTALVNAQRRLQEQIEGFRFNLGFSGKFYHAGTAEENKGDTALLEKRQHFWWFPHMWRHMQPHKFLNTSQLEWEMLLNYKFAQEHNIPVNHSYAVAPHHSGVYPVHEQLYEAWKKVWGIKVTSTEEYPHLRPARYRRGFIHRGLMVLPRQTCGLYTHNLFIDQYPGGRGRLEESIRGGELFQTIAFTPINIFMTHLSNYGNDRLALYTFESVVKFVQCWTNLRLKTKSPLELAKKYFTMYPEEEDPIWQNPCDDARHEHIWSTNKTCERLPRFLVIGPQKTGTTALYTFLAMHPAVQSNYPSQTTFEEVQFFNGRNYYKGLDWYMEFFPLTRNASAAFLFEKSANYFDSELSPMRAYALVPKARLVCILLSPAKRAYSWYQHMRAHKDPSAMTYSFYEVVSATEDSPRPLRELKHRCLNPGYYAQHIERWLDYFPAQQLLIIDGDQLKSDPITVMDKVQVFLGIEPYYDYSRWLKYNPKKGFYCQVVTGDHTKCLGRSKGRIYPPMDPRSEKYLAMMYRRHNIALSKLLSRLNTHQPSWLQEELSSGLS